MIRSILIANRGEIACRVIRTAKRLGIRTLAVYSEADQRALHVSLADEAVLIGPPEATRSYLHIETIVQAAREFSADAVHPGYGFLSENAEFAEALANEGIAFIGPRPKAIRAMGDKIESKRIASEAGVSTVPGHLGVIESASDAQAIADSIGYPVMIKASAGGGGKGMRIAWNAEEVENGYRSSRNEAASAFGDDRLFIEKFILAPRHIEIQLLTDRHGNAVYLNERECSIQRRNQKVVEEAPSPFLNEQTRRAMGEQAVALAQAVEYESAGTVEFIVDKDRNFYFLEMNTRLQVEHPVTELTTGVDLVEEMIRIAEGRPLGLAQSDVRPMGWAIESRIYAEDPYRNFLPSTGRLVRYRPPEESEIGETVIRNDTGVEEGGEISVFYDPMIAKLCTRGRDRDEAIATMQDALDAFEIEGIANNIPFLASVMENTRFRSGDLTTAFIEEEYPNGFENRALTECEFRKIAASVAVMHRVSEIRSARISGRVSHHKRRVGNRWFVVLQGREVELSIAADRSGSTVTFADGGELRVSSDWRPGQTTAILTLGESRISLRVKPVPLGYQVRFLSTRLRVKVLTPRQMQLSAHMAVKLPQDRSKQLLCPMPGLVTSVLVSPGDSVEEGQALCVVEAMKMENTLRAERSGRVAEIHAVAGQSMAVDDVIMEFD